MDISDKPQEADALIIGGGLVGLASALELARRGAKVTCLEADHFGAHQSAQNWGFVRKQGRALAEIPLMLDAITRWSHLSDHLGADVQWVQGGNLAVFETAAQEEQYKKWLRSLSDLNIDSKLLKKDQIVSIVPGWKRSIRGALFSPSDGQAEPSAVIEAYLHACHNAGVRLVQGAEAHSLLTRGSVVVGAKVRGQTYYADTTVVSVGSSTRKLLSTIDIDFPQSFVTGTVSLTTPTEPLTKSTVWGNGFSFRQRHDGRIVCSVGGGGVVRLSLDLLTQVPLFLTAFKKNWRKFSIRPSLALATELPMLLRGRAGMRSTGAPTPTVSRSESSNALRKLQGTVKGLDHIEIEHSWAGIIDSTPDGNPVIDSDPGPGGLVIASGFSGHGYGLVPTVGNIVADLVSSAKTNFDLHPFRLGRFAAQDFVTPNAVL